KDHPKAGIVGEIYVKYNTFSNNNAAQCLMGQGMEVVLPTFLEFFAGSLIHNEQSVKTNLVLHVMMWLLSPAGKENSLQLSERDRLHHARPSTLPPSS
ncbi:hypothetical protein JZU69_00920, partial [bacterium]|nr:hypothetical protein [bacterium]